MNENLVPVISMTRNITVLSLPEYHLTKTWPKKGARIMVSKEALANSIYQTGVEALFTQGFLWIDDANFRKELGLEPDDGEKEETRLIQLDDKFINRIISLMPVVEVEATLKKLTDTQKLEVADYAVEHYLDLKMDRIEILSKYCNTDIIKAVDMKKDLEG